MARLVGTSTRRNPELVRLLTAAAAVVGAVVLIFAALALVDAGRSTGAVVVMVLMGTVALVVGKLLADRRLLRVGTRRTDDTEAAQRALEQLSDSWWVFRDVYLNGGGIEFLVVGPGGLYAVELYRWLGRETGTAFPERLTEELASRARDVAGGIARMVGSRVHVQPVYLVLEDEVPRLGDHVLHPAAADLYHLRGVLLVSHQEIRPLLQSGASLGRSGTRGLDTEQAGRLARSLQARLG